MSKPRDFGWWTSAWAIRPISWVEDGHLVEQDVWLRDYREKSHCDTPGCCELPGTKMGPALGDVRIVREVCE